MAKGESLLRVRKEMPSPLIVSVMWDKYVDKEFKSSIWEVITEANSLYPFVIDPMGPGSWSLEGSSSPADYYINKAIKREGGIPRLIDDDLLRELEGASSELCPRRDILLTFTAISACDDDSKSRVVYGRGARTARVIRLSQYILLPGDERQAKVKEVLHGAILDFNTT